MTNAIGAFQFQPHVVAILLVIAAMCYILALVFSYVGWDLMALICLVLGTGPAVIFLVSVWTASGIWISSSAIGVGLGSIVFIVVSILLGRYVVMNAASDEGLFGDID